MFLLCSTVLVSCIFLSYYYLIKTTQLQFDWYLLECRKNKNKNKTKHDYESYLFLQMNSSYIHMNIQITQLFHLLLHLLHMIIQHGCYECNISLYELNFVRLS